MVIKTFVIFVLAAVDELGGIYCYWRWLKEKGPGWRRSSASWRCSAMSTSRRSSREAIVREGMGFGELRGDVPAEPLAQAIAELADLAPAEYWASRGARPSLAEIPELVLSLLLRAGLSE